MKFKFVPFFCMLSLLNAATTNRPPMDAVQSLKIEIASTQSLAKLEDCMYEATLLWEGKDPNRYKVLEAFLGREMGCDLLLENIIKADWVICNTNTEDMYLYGVLLTHLYVRIITPQRIL